MYYELLRMKNEIALKSAAVEASVSFGIQHPVFPETVQASVSFVLAHLLFPEKMLGTDCKGKLMSGHTRMLVKL